jgi:hypothetical protein
MDFLVGNLYSLFRLLMDLYFKLPVENGTPLRKAPATV